MTGPHPLFVFVCDEVGAQRLDLGYGALGPDAHQVGPVERTVEHRLVCCTARRQWAAAVGSGSTVASSCPRASRRMCGRASAGRAHGTRTVGLLGQGVAGHSESIIQVVIAPSVLLPFGGAHVPGGFPLHFAWVSVLRAFLSLCAVLASRAAEQATD